MSSQSENDLSSTDQTTINIIEQEINLLRKKQFSNIELTFAETKKLETLIKIRMTLHEKPIDFVKPDYGAVSDEDVLNTIKEHLGEIKPKKARKKKG